MKPSKWLITDFRRRDLVICGLVIATHVLLTAIFRRSAEIVSTVFFITIPLIVMGLCVCRARQVDAASRPGWIFLAIAMADWAAGSALSLWVDETHPTSIPVAGAPDFLFFFYGVGILLAATWAEEDGLLGVGFWFDGLQASLGSYLAFIVLFNALPFSDQHLRPVSGRAVLTTYDMENAALVVLSLCRFIGRVPSASRWQFDRVMVIFTIPYAIVASLYNHFFNASGLTDAMIDVPFLLLIMAARSKAQPSVGLRPARNVLALLFDSAGPMFFALTNLAFGIIVARAHFRLGLCCLLIALILYGTRAALLQSRYLRVQIALGEALDRLGRLSFEDSLTGIANRRNLDAFMRQCWDARLRTGQPMSFLLLDVDHFKNLNDREGHRAGDDCLCLIAAALRATITRRGDLVARYGGEEFAVVLPNTDLCGAARVAQSVKEAVDALAIPNEISGRAFVTVSIGVASSEDAGWSDPDALVIAADRALYAAKQSGRNRVELAPGSGRISPESDHLRESVAVI